MHAWSYYCSAHPRENVTRNGENLVYRKIGWYTGFPDCAWMWKTKLGVQGNQRGNCFKGSRFENHFSAPIFLILWIHIFV
jgi:hypothetical protein